LAFPSWRNDGPISTQSLKKGDKGGEKSKKPEGILLRKKRVNHPKFLTYLISLKNRRNNAEGYGKQRTRRTSRCKLFFPLSVHKFVISGKGNGREKDPVETGPTKDKGQQHSVLQKN